MTAPTRFHTPWRKSSYSADSNCVEVAFGWRKSSYSGNDSNCVEVALGSAVVGVRDSKNPGAGQLAMSEGVFRTFMSGIREDQLDRG